MLFEIYKRGYRAAMRGEDFGEETFSLVTTVDASTKRKAQNIFKKQHPGARFSEGHGKYACWQKI